MLRHVTQDAGQLPGGEVCELLPPVMLRNGNHHPAVRAGDLVGQIVGGEFRRRFLTMLGGLKKTDRFRHILMGVAEEYRNRGIEIAFYTNIVENARKHGYREVEMSNIVETNYSMRNSLKHFPIHIYKTYRIYEKDIEPNGK